MKTTKQSIGLALAVITAVGAFGISEARAESIGARGKDRTFILIVQNDFAVRDLGAFAVRDFAVKDLDASEAKDRDFMVRDLGADELGARDIGAKDLGALGAMRNLGQLGVRGLGVKDLGAVEEIGASETDEIGAEEEIGAQEEIGADEEDLGARPVRTIKLYRIKDLGASE